MNKQQLDDKFKQSAKRYLVRQVFSILDDSQDKYFICRDDLNTLSCVYLQFKIVEEKQDIFDDDSTPAIRCGMENAVGKYIFNHPDEVVDMDKINLYVLSISVPASVLDDNFTSTKSFVRFHRYV